MGLEVQKLDEKATLPTVGHPGEDLGYDVYALEDTTILPLTVAKIRTGIAARYVHRGHFLDEVKKYGLLIRDRSSMAVGGLFVVGGVVDAGYTGEIIVLLRTMGNALVDIKAGQKVAQMIPIEVRTGGVMHVAEVEDLNPQAARGWQGFGSTGK